MRRQGIGMRVSTRRPSRAYRNLRNWLMGSPAWLEVRAAHGPWDAARPKSSGSFARLRRTICHPMRGRQVPGRSYGHPASIRCFLPPYRTVASD